MDPGFVVLNVAGVGYKVYVPIETAGGASVGDEISLWTHLVVRETALDLYGFEDRESVDFFELLIGVSGIGPKGALGILSIAPVSSLKDAISAGETSYLTKVSGIGKKNAEKIVLELRDKVGLATSSGEELRAGSDAIEALMALGYTQKESREALKIVPDEATNTSDKVTAALKVLGNNQ